MKSMAVSHGYRSARDAYPAPSVPPQPTVSVVIPVYAEIGNIRRLASEVLSQDYPQIQQILFVDGLSTDGTFEALGAIARNDSRVKVIRNPKKLPAPAVNLALRHIASDVFIRLDAHGNYAPDVVSESVKSLLATDAGGVGAVASPLSAQTLVGRAIATAHTSKLGVGVARFRQINAEGWVDSVWNGCYWMHVVKEVGPLNETLWRAEDNDFNERVRRAGFGLYLSPKIKAWYQPRQSFRALWSQYFSNGTGIMLALSQNARAVTLRHLVPFLFIVSLVLLSASSLLWHSMFQLFLGVLSLYLAALIGATVVAFLKTPGVHLLLLPSALLTLHFSYGLGSLYGALLLVRRAMFANKAAVESPS